MIDPVRVDRLPLVVGYTGIKADTPTLVRQVADLYKRKPRLVKGVFDSIQVIVEEGRKAFRDGDFRKLGALTDKNEYFLEKLGVGSPELSNLILAARGAGATGAKLSGAGGGDCMIAIVMDTQREFVEAAIGRSGGKIIQVETGAKGVRVESYKSRQYLKYKSFLFSSGKSIIQALTEARSSLIAIFSSRLSSSALISPNLSRVGAIRIEFLCISCLQ